MAIPIALGAAAFFGMAPVLLRRALDANDWTLTALVPTSIGAVGCGLYALARGETSGNVVPFFVLGLLVPGLAQILLVHAVRLVGPSRSAVATSTSPLLSVGIAIAIVGEPAKAGLLVACVLIVAGSASLVLERRRPPQLRRAGYAFAVGTAVSFAIRDNVLRHLSLHTRVGPALAGTAMLTGASVIAGALVVVQRMRSGTPLPLGRKSLLIPPVWRWRLHMSDPPRPITAAASP